MVQTQIRFSDRRCACRRACRAPSATCAPVVAAPAVAADPAPVAAPVARPPLLRPAANAPSATAAITATMMDYPLTLQYAANRAKNYFADREIVTPHGGRLRPHHLRQGL